MTLLEQLRQAQRIYEAGNGNEYTNSSIIGNLPQIIKELEKLERYEEAVKHVRIELMKSLPTTLNNYE